MYTRHVRLAGVYELEITPRGSGTAVTVDTAAIEQWARSVARDVGLNTLAIAAHDASVRMVVSADRPSAVMRLWRWVPSLRARPLHTVLEFVNALDALAVWTRTRSDTAPDTEPPTLPSRRTAPDTEPPTLPSRRAAPALALAVTTHARKRP